MNRQSARTAKGPIEYISLGSGPTVLVCHGTSSNCYSSELAGSLVQAGFRLRTPSRPGYGQTPLRVGRTAAQAADGMVAVRDSLTTTCCSVVAVSGGGPTGIILAENYPSRVGRLIFAEAISWAENRPHEPSYKNQMACYGPMHNVFWAMLGLMGRISPRGMARQTLAIFSTHNPDEGLSKLTTADIENISRFDQGRSSRLGALNDATHLVGPELLQQVHLPSLVIHSREDNSVPSGHAEWPLKNIPHAELCESGFTGHFFWIGPDNPAICRKMITFLNSLDEVFGISIAQWVKMGFDPSCVTVVAHALIL